ncbi:MAG: LptA/OstA family protein [Syntrophales bacterium]|jgi:lipopolysaccharide export system protein LptA
MPKKADSFMIRMAALALAVFCLSAGCVWAEAKMPVSRSEPIQIVSDRLDAYDEKKMVVFSGHAVAVQGDKSIRADSITLFYKKENQPVKPKASKGPDLGGGDLDRVEAKGHVIITQGPKTVTGDFAVYFQDDQKIEMTGNAVLKEGRSTIHGDKVVVLLNEGRGFVESGTSKRVMATIYPSDRSAPGKKKP